VIPSDPDENVSKERTRRMKRNAGIFCFLVLTLVAMGGCSSQPQADGSKKAGPALDRIQGKAQVLVESSGSTDAALNAGGASVYLWEGTHRYRLFLRTPADIVHGNEYVAEGVNAQKAIDEIGDPDQGKNGYPLQASCERVVKKAWSNISFDAVEPTATLLRTRVKRYPARTVFLVTRIQPVTSKEGGAGEPKKDAAAEEKDVREVAVAPEKQRAFLIEGPTVLPAPLWEPAGGKVSCKVVIGTDGKISDLETGAQLCEAVQWSQFRYQPPVQAGHPVRVSTEVEVSFEPRK
jgi:hypothetical protein